MSSFIIEGGHRLHGTIIPQGAKNEALQVLCATLLTEDCVRIKNIPDILDVNNLIQLLADIGVEITVNGPNDMTFCARHINADYLQSETFYKRCSSLRGSILLIGPCLARFGRTVVAQPGGDKIGRRRLDTHFYGISKLGATFDYDEKLNIFNVQAPELKGTYMLLDEASVTGTANIIMAAVLAEGTTTIIMLPANLMCSSFVTCSMPWAHASVALLLILSPLSGLKNCMVLNIASCPI